MLPKILFVVVASALAGSGWCADEASSRSFLVQLPWETRDHLLQLQPHLNVTQLTDHPIPLYRPDLGDQIAYWLISYNHHHYAILSAGPHTGDSMLLLQGEGPSPLASLHQQALSLHNSTCGRYLVMTPSPDLNLACDTPQGLRLTSRPLAADVNTSTLWKEIKSKGQFDNDEEITDDNDNSYWHFHILSAMEPGSFPMTGMRGCHIRSLGQSDGSDVSVEVLCKLLGVCDHLGRVHTHRQADYGEVYVHLEPVHEESLPRFEHDLHFEVVGHHPHHGLTIKRFAVEPSHRSKRQSAYTYYSINDRQLMPDYNQFKRGKCQVGCGPVAWAQVFGYYDRRAHSGSGSSASQALYRCGSDGTTGSNSCRAPKYNDNRMKNYIGKMNDIMRTFCLFGQGATFQRRMDDVEGFFKQRQGSSGNVILKYRKFFLARLVGANSDKVRNSALSYLRQKWPVIVGFKVSGLFSQHYAVMTQYRTRTVRKKVCKVLIFCKTRTVREYDMYLHMGWGGSSNGWRSAKMFMAAVATY